MRRLIALLLIALLTACASQAKREPGIALPPLRLARSRIYVNEGLPQQQAQLLREAIEEVMPPNAQCGPEARSRLPEPALI